MPSFGPISGAPISALPESGGSPPPDPDPDPGVPASDASFNASTIMRFNPLNRAAVMTAASLNRTANLL